MKTIKMNSRLADFENELENLNHSEMKELVGGDYSYTSNGGGGGGIMTFTCVATPNSGGSFGGYNSFSDFTSSYAASSAASSSSSMSSAAHSGGSSSSTPTTQVPPTDLELVKQCIKGLDRINDRDLIRECMHRYNTILVWF